MAIGQAALESWHSTVGSGLGGARRRTKDVAAFVRCPLFCPGTQLSPARDSAATEDRWLSTGSSANFQTREGPEKVLLSGAYPYAP